MTDELSDTDKEVSQLLKDTKALTSAKLSYVHAGRPTTYTPELGELILSFMSEGMSLAAAAGMVNVHRQRVYDWEKTHPEFGELVKLARVKRLAYLERDLLTTNQGARVTASIFALKNAAPEDWRDRHEVVTKQADTIDLSQLSDEQLTQLQEALRFVNAKQIDHD